MFKESATNQDRSPGPAPMDPAGLPDSERSKNPSVPESTYKPYAEEPARSERPYKPYGEPSALDEVPYEPYKGI